jgi:hypothetical protein
LLEQTLEEEKVTDEKLTQLAEQINAQAGGEETEIQSRETGSKQASKSRSRRAA